MGKKKVCKITIQEFDSNMDKYFDIAEKEKVYVYKNNKKFFVIDKKTLKKVNATKRFIEIMRSTYLKDEIKKEN